MHTCPDKDFTKPNFLYCIINHYSYSLFKIFFNTFHFLFFIIFIENDISSKYGLKGTNFYFKEKIPIN